MTNVETLNKTSSAFNCTSPLDNVNFEDPRILGSLLPLGMVCLMVILGNIMVIVAVKITHKLRGATNLFIGKKYRPGQPDLEFECENSPRAVVSTFALKNEQ